MNKKVMALAVAGALAVPGVALAQVTISGGFRVGLSQHNISNVQSPTTGGPRGNGIVNSNLSETRVSDNVSQIIFGAREDLGGGLTAVGRYEWRPLIDGAGSVGGQLGNGTGAATNYVGLESTTMGKLLVGSVNTYAGAGGTGGGYTADRALAFMSNVGIMQQVYTGAVVSANSTAAAEQTNFGQGRQTNSITWNSPNWGGFTLTGVWSSQNAGNDADLAAVPAGATQAARKGSAYIIAPGYSNGPFSAQYLYFNNKVDGFALVGATGSVRDIKANKIWATYNFGGGFSLTGAWNKVTLNNAYTGAGATTSFGGGSKLADQVKWMVSGKYATGPHTFTADYTKANSDKIVTNAAGQTGNTGAKQWSTSWMYELSKRTEVGLSYTRVTNDAFAAYGPQDTASNALGGTGVAGNAGETYTIWGANMTHKF